MHDDGAAAASARAVNAKAYTVGNEVVFSVQFESDVIDEVEALIPLGPSFVSRRGGTPNT